MKALSSLGRFLRHLFRADGTANVEEPRPVDMHRADIVALIKKQGYTLERLGLSHGLSRSAVSVAISKPFPAGEQLIAHTIGRELHEIWPSRHPRPEGRQQ